MALTKGRIDQGLDIGGSGSLRAVGDGIVQSVGLWPGWPGSGGLVYQLTNGRKIFVEEGFQPSVKTGDRVKAGQVIGQVLPGTSTGIETGYANAAGTGPLDPYNGRPDGTSTAGGQAFARDYGAASLKTGPAPSSGFLGTGVGPNVPLPDVLKPPDVSSLNPVDAIKAFFNDLWSQIKAQAAYAGLAAVVVIGGFALLATGLLHATHNRPEPS